MTTQQQQQHQKMIALTGATGRLGRRTLHYLLETSKIAPEKIIVITRDPSKVTDETILTSGVQIRKGDFLQKTEDLAEAFAGADKLLITSTDTMDDQLRLKQHFNAIDAAKLAGVRHVFYTSLAFGGYSDVSVAFVQRAHLLTEAYLKESGLTYTILREGIYSEATSLFLGYFNPSAYNGEDLPIVADGKVAWTSREDLGLANALIIGDSSDQYENKTLLLTSEESYTLKETAEIISKYLPKPISLKIVDRDTYIAHHKDINDAFAPYRGRFTYPWSTSHDGIERGEAAKTSPFMNQLISKVQAPTSFESVVEAMFTKQ